MRKFFTLAFLSCSIFCIAQNDVQNRYSSCYTPKGIFQDPRSKFIIDSISKKGPVINQMLEGRVVSLNIQNTDTTPRIFLRCGTRRLASDKPLLVVDTEIRPLAELSYINPNDIISVDVLKSAPATILFGSDAVNGAIIVSTVQNKFRVTDSADETAIAYASVEFYCKESNHHIRLIANANGIAVPPELTRGSSYKMKISAVGYEVHESWVNYKTIAGKNIKLNRAVISLKEFVVSKIVCPGYRRHVVCTGQKIAHCSFSAIKNENENSNQDKKAIRSFISSFNAYPNPMIRGSYLNVMLNSDKKAAHALRLLAVDGRLLWQQSIQVNKSTNSYHIPTQSGWAAGIYFIQLLYENGQVLASEKIIIQ